MKTIETVINPFTWNYTHIKGTTFSRTLVFSADLTGAVFNLIIAGSNRKAKPTVKFLGVNDKKETFVNISLTAQETLEMSVQNKWSLFVTYRSETFVCWTGQFNLRSV